MLHIDGVGEDKEAVEDKLSGASLNRHRSKQDYSTPDSFIEAVERRFGNLYWDLAASATNTKCRNYFDEQVDSLKQPWFMRDGLLWLNPPFNNIEPWAKKCAEESANGARILFLTPASIGANWFRDHVHHKAMVLALNGRLSFDGNNPYPKDCILNCYLGFSGFDVWDWKVLI